MSNLEKLIALYDSGVTLRDEDHVYVFPNGHEIHTSVTDIVEQQFPFDAEEIAKILTRNHPDYEHLTWKELCAQWDKTRDYGSLVHKDLADALKNNTQPSEKKSIAGKKWFDKIIAPRSEMVFVEVTVYGKSIELAGQVDLVAVDPKTDSCFVFDWKTTPKDIDSKRRKKYSLQLSLYSYLLQEHGIKVKGQYIIHLMENRAITYEAENQLAYVENIIASKFDAHGRFVHGILNGL